jgi:hypothetical protein
VTAREHAGIVECAHFNTGRTSDDAPCLHRRLVCLNGMVMLDWRVAGVEPCLTTQRAKIAVQVATPGVVDELVTA